MSTKLRNEFTEFQRFVGDEIPNDSDISLEECVRLWRKAHVTGANGISRETPFERAKRLGLVGAIQEGPSDLATNPQYLEGFGNS